MARILGVPIPKQKRVVIALSYIYGIGMKRSQLICSKLNIDDHVRVHELEEIQVNAIISQIEKSNYMTEGHLRRKVSSDVKNLISLRSYRGIRHIKGLPVNGQRTKCNARTRKRNKRR